MARNSWLLITLIGSWACGGQVAGAGVEPNGIGGNTNTAAASGGMGVMPTGGAHTAMGGSPAVTVPVDRVEFPKRLARAFCEGIAHCCIDGGFPTNTAACEATMATAINDAFMVEYSSPYIAYDAVAAGACVNAFRFAASDCYNPNAGNDVDAICNQAFLGEEGLGAKCAQRAECTQYEEPVDCVMGVCTISPSTLGSPSAVHATLGQACGQTCQSSGDGSMGCSGSVSMAGTTSSASCWVDDGLVCGTNGRCEPVPSLGQSCASAYYCMPGAYCNGAICMPQITTGSCAGSAYSACSSISAYCEMNTLQCTPKKPDGAVCGSSEDCIGGQCEAGRCRVWSLANASTCAGLMN